MTDPYNDLLRSLFFDLRHAGGLQQGYDKTLSAVAGSEAGGASVELVAGVSDGELRELAFRAYACPHLVAACEFLCRQVNDGNGRLPRRLPRQELTETLGVPVEKTGRILILEDALESLVAQLART